MLYAPGLVVGRLLDRVYLRLPVLVASVVFVICMFLTAECTQYWQFLLCQGFGIGVSHDRCFVAEFGQLTSVDLLARNRSTV